MAEEQTAEERVTREINFLQTGWEGKTKTKQLDSGKWLQTTHSSANKAFRCKQPDHTLLTNP